MPGFRVARIHHLPADLDLLLEESRQEGHLFLVRLRDEWHSGANRFDAPGEALLEARDAAGRLLGIGGINRDPYLDDPACGRIRHLYVARPARRRGVAAALVRDALLHAGRQFERVRLRTRNPEAARFYERMGFTPVEDLTATHGLRQTHGNPGRAVVVTPYDPAWASEFRELRAVLLSYLDGLPARIEHVGSTSVAGLAAKPILDVDVILERAINLDEVTVRLERAGYIAQGTRGIPGRHAFARSDDAVPRSKSHSRWGAHHLYAGTADARGIREHLYLRDLLRRDPELVARYGARKLELARLHPNDINAYMLGKTDLIREMMAGFEG